MRRALLLLLLASSAHASAQTTADSLLTAAYRAVLDAPAFTYRFSFRSTAGDSTDVFEGTATTHARPPDGIPHFRLDFADETAAFDGEVYRVRFPRTQRVYVDSTLEKMDEGRTGLVALHPTLGLKLYYTLASSQSVTDDGPDAVDGAPCHAVTYGRTAGGTGPAISVCYDDALHVPSRVHFSVSDTLSADLTVSDIRIVPVPADTTFSLPTPPGYTAVPYTSDEPLLAVGDVAPAFAFTGPGPGPTLQLDDYRGRPVLIDFWGTWCPPCVAAIPDMEALHRDYPELAVLGFAAYEESDPEPLARQRGATYPILRIPEELAEAYHVHVFPTYYLIGPDGTVRFAIAHTDDAGDTSAAVRAAVAVLLGPPR